MVDIASARLDVFDIDDFVVSIEKEAQALTEKFNKKLQEIKESNSGIKDFFKEIGAIKSSDSLINRWTTIGLVDIEIDNKLLGKFKPEVNVLEYSTKVEPDEGLLISKETQFNRHIILTTSKETYDSLREVVHTASLLIQIDNKGNIIESTPYTKAKYVAHTTYLKPKSVLNITVKNSKASTQMFEDLHKRVYENFCVETNLHEFGTRFRSLSPTNEKNRDAVYAPSHEYLPLAIRNQSNCVTVTNGFAKKITGRHPTRKELAIAEVLNDTTIESDTLVQITARYRKVADRYLRSMKHNFKIELDAIIDETTASTIFTTIATAPIKSYISERTLKYVYKNARYNRLFYKGNRNIMIEDMTEEQKGFFSVVNHINQHHNLNLKYHQLFAVMNTIPHRVAILKADVGLGKTRSAIASILTRGGKHNLIVTEPGNVLELEREFKEQLNMGDVTNVIKKECDLQNLKTFNLVGYSTIKKVLKKSSLEDLPMPVKVFEIMHADNVFKFDIAKTMDYWTAFSDKGESIEISDGAINSNIKEELITSTEDLEKTKTTAAVLLSIGSLVSDAENRDDISGTLIKIKNFLDDKANSFPVFTDILMKYTDKILEVSEFVDEIDKFGFGSRGTNIYSTAYIANIDDPYSVSSSTLQVPGISGITVPMGIFLPIISVLSAVNTFGQEKLAEVFDNTHSQFYFINKKLIDRFLELCSTIELNKFQKENPETAFIRLRGDRFSVASNVIYLIVDLFKTAVSYTVDDALHSAATNMKLEPFLERVSVHEGVEPLRNKSLAEEMNKLNPEQIINDACHSVGKVAKMFAIIIGKLYHSIDLQKTRAKYRVKTFATKLSGKFNTVVFDECHNLKNLSSSTTMAATQLRAKNYLFMSATPVGNHMGELLSYLVIGYGLRSLKHTLDIEARRYTNGRSANRNGRKQYCIEVGANEVSYDVDITSAIGDITKKGYPMVRLDSFVENNVTRVLRNDSNIVKDEAFKFDLKEYRLYSKPSQEHMALYAAQMEIVYEALSSGKYEDTREALSTLTNLIKISEIPHLISDEFENALTNKQNDIVELARKNLEDGRSVIVFTQFQDMVQIIAKELSTRTTCNVYMLGDNLTPDKRFKLIDAFRKQKGNAAIVGTVNNLGKGFNLANADVIIMSDIPWSPLLYAQSIGRILRPDQVGTPEVYMVMNKYMIDMYKFDTIRAKLNMIKKYLDKDDKVTEQDTHKVDYKLFLVSLLEKAIKDGVLAKPQDQTVISGGV